MLEFGKTTALKNKLVATERNPVELSLPENAAQFKPIMRIDHQQLQPSELYFLHAFINEPPCSRLKRMPLATSALDCQESGR